MVTCELSTAKIVQLRRIPSTFSTHIHPTLFLMSPHINSYTGVEVRSSFPAPTTPLGRGPIRKPNNGALRRPYLDLVPLPLSYTLRTYSGSPSPFLFRTAPAYSAHTTPHHRCVRGCSVDAPLAFFVLPCRHRCSTSMTCGVALLIVACGRWWHRQETATLILCKSRASLPFSISSHVHRRHRSALQRALLFTITYSCLNCRHYCDGDL